MIDGKVDDRGGALIGELMSREAIDRGFVRVVVDGPVRDAAGVGALRFPMFPREIMPSVGVNRRPGQTQVPVIDGGVVVHPGDVVLADDDVDAATPRADLAQVVDAVEANEWEGIGLAEAIGRHDRLADLLGLTGAIHGR